MPKGKLIVIEGTDASGKKTQAELLHSAYWKAKYKTAKVSFPRYGEYSASLVEAYLAGKFGKNPESVNPYAGSLLYSVDRFASYRDRTDSGSWGEIYDKGGIVIADRYTTSNVVHQMEKIQTEAERRKFIRWLYDIEYGKMGIPRPDAVIFLHMPTEVAAKLMQKRADLDKDHKTDIHEKDPEYMKKCLEAGLFAAQADGWTVIDCAKDGQPLPKLEIHGKVLQAVNAIIDEKEIASWN